MKNEEQRNKKVKAEGKTHKKYLARTVLACSLRLTAYSHIHH